VIRKEIEYMLSGIPDHLQNINILWEDPIRNEEDYQQRQKITAYYALWNEIGCQPPVDLLQNEKRVRYYNKQSQRFNELRERDAKEKELRKIRKWLKKQKNPKSPYRKMMIHLYNLAINSGMKATEIKRKAKMIRDREKMEAQRDKFLRLSPVEQARLWEQVERQCKWQWISQRPVKE